MEAVNSADVVVFLQSAFEGSIVQLEQCDGRDVNFPKGVEHEVSRCSRDSIAQYRDYDISVEQKSAHLKSLSISGRSCPAMLSSAAALISSRAGPLASRERFFSYCQSSAKGSGINEFPLWRMKT
jgi:hypothetical protein